MDVASGLAMHDLQGVVVKYGEPACLGGKGCTGCGGGALITQRNGALSVLQRGEAELWAEKSNVGKVVNRGCGVPDGFSVVPPYMNQRAVMFGQAVYGDDEG